ncbi:MAG TPA: glycosyltransferase, partial [Bacteroidales bacterium]|nr:glycosyltransferase [Bacteroidales bacterium]
MKYLVLTIAIGEEYRQLSVLTHPTIKTYADRIGADFIAITDQAISKTTPHWEKFQIYHYLEIYDRVLYIDTDVIIRDDCPNLFSIVPDTHLGMFEEGRFTQRGYDLMIQICKAYNVVLPDWNGKYYNSGVMVISRVHRSLFKKPEKEVPNFFEQSYLNMLIAKRETDIYEIEHKFNRMTCMDRFTGEERFASYIIHYAGWYWKASEVGAPSNIEYILSLIKNDLDKWSIDRPGYHYRKHLYIAITGGMGDQLCAEPVIRWMKERLYPDDEMIVATHYPRLFKHIEGIEVVEHGKANLRNDTPYFIGESLPNPNTLQWSIVSHLLCHCVDYVSIALMHRTLPVINKTIRFVVDQVDIDGLNEKTGG